MKARQVGHRLTICLLTMAMTAVAWWEPASLSHHLLTRVDGWAQAVSIAMVLLAAIGVADVVVNDMLPPRFVLPGVDAYRHLGYMALGAMHLVYVYSMARSWLITWLAAQFLVAALGCIWIACFDTYYHRQGKSHA